MANPAAILHGVNYHIFNRGNNRETIFVEEGNYRYFLQLYARHVSPITDTYAYCLMRNHFHFLVRINPLAKITPGLQSKKPGQIFGNLFNAYTKAFNNRYGRSGSLFEHPFGRIQIKSSEHFARLVSYIHQNPQKHGYVDDFRTWPYSSYHAIWSSGPTRLDREKVQDWFGDLAAFERDHIQPIKNDEIKEYFPEDIY